MITPRLPSQRSENMCAITSFPLERQCLLPTKIHDIVIEPGNVGQPHVLPLVLQEGDVLPCPTAGSVDSIVLHLGRHGSMWPSVSTANANTALWITSIAVSNRCNHTACWLCQVWVWSCSAEIHIGALLQPTSFRRRLRGVSWSNRSVQ